MNIAYYRRLSALMSRKPGLKPSFRKGRVSPWCVNIPAGLSETGKKREEFFATKQEAIGLCERLKARRDNFGIALSAMTGARLAAAIESYRLLDPLGIDLLDAVRAHIQLVAQRNSSVTLGVAFDRFAELKADRSRKYVEEIRHAKATFDPLLGSMIADVHAGDLEAILDRLPPGARNAKMRRLRSVFNLAIKREWIRPGTSPIARMDFVSRPRKEVETVPNAQVAAMLMHAFENDLPLLPCLALGFFAGIRPEGELVEVEWADIKFAAGQIVIRPEVSKTNRRRFIDISDNLKAWLEAYRARGGAFEGKIVSFTPTALRAHRRANWKAAGVIRWVQQGMRHCYCSNWLAIHKDVNKLVLQSGHDSVDTMWRNYHAGVPEEDAKKFWAIMPPAAVENVIAFQQM